ncbi:MAG: transglutaminase domain-containing protein [Clostridia bacterium]|nr:transglutaminase domain-containing protein [Clostridia bacterium]
MKKVLSRILYVLFFGFAIVLFTACILLIINTSKSKTETYNQIEAVVISNGEEQTDSDYKTISKIQFEKSPYYEPVTEKHGYKALVTDEEQYLYEKIEKNIYSLTQTTDENGHYRTRRQKINGTHMSEESIRKVVNAFTYDNPQVFWLENLFGYAYAGDDTIVEFYSVLSADDCIKYIDKFTTKVNEIISGADKGMSEYDREKYIHDTVLNYCEYKNGVTGSNDGWQYFSAYGALIDGQAVCEGYAKSMQILLAQLGIECYTISGDADNVGHMWNIVKLGGEWYHLDSTWDDTDGTINYEYFNVNTETISKNHNINDSVNITDSDDAENSGKKYNFFIPMCSSMAMNYYNVEGYLLENFDEKSDNDMIQLIVNAVNKGDTYIPLRLGSSMTYNEYIDSLFYQSPYKFYYYIQNANEMLDSEHQIDKDSISVLKNESMSTLRIKLNIITNE